MNGIFHRTRTQNFIICMETQRTLNSQKQPWKEKQKWTNHIPWLQSVQSSRSVMSDSLRPHESQHTKPPCPSPTPGVYSNSCPSSWWCHPAISSSVVPFSSCPQSLPASGSLQAILQICRNQNLLLAQKQKYRSKEEGRKPRNIPLHLWSINLWQGSQEYTM